MLRCRVLLELSVPKRWMNSSSAAPVASGIGVAMDPVLAVQSVGYANADQITAIFNYIDGVSAHDICQSNSDQALKLVNMITNIEQGHNMRKIKNKLIRKFKVRYSAVFYAMRKLSHDATRLDMAMLRKLGPKQCMAFHETLTLTITRDDYSIEQKRQKIYNTITLQHDLYPETSKRRGIIVPENVHKWFWENIAKKDSFNHYYFLIKNDVHLSSSLSIKRFSKRLMQGSEMEVQLASMQIFLQNDVHKELFYSKFSKLYSFDFMLLILNKLIYRKDFRYIKMYLSALLFKMDTKEVQNYYSSVKSKQLLFVKFNNSLLYYLSQSQNIDMFLETFTTELQFMKKMGLLEKTGGVSTMNLLHKPLIFIIKLLRKGELHEEVFRLIAIVQKLPIQKNYHFNQLILNELISSFRSFNDPKLTCHYAISGFKKAATGELLNDLGLWSSVFHNHHHSLSKEALLLEIDSFESLLPRSMRVNTIPSCATLTEIYRVLLSTNARIMNQEQYQNFILNLYSSYTNFLRQKKSKLKHFSHDTGILIVFLHHIRFELKNFKLAFELLKDFYDQPFHIGIRNTSTKCPFSLVLYKNSELNQSQVDYLLILMQKHQIPLSFQFCTAMVLRYLKLNNPDEASSWYKRILHAGFTVDHALLIQAMKENGWEHPINFDSSALDKIDADLQNTTEDALFIEGTNEVIDSNTPEDSIDQGNSLLRLIEIVKYIN